MEYLSLAPIGKGLFVAGTIAAIVVFAYVMYRRLGLLFLGQFENRFDRLPARFWAMIKYGFGQYKMPQELIPGLLHIFIFVGFMVLTVRTVEIFVMGVTAQVFSTVTGNSSLGSRIRLKSFGVPSASGGVNQLCISS